MYRESFSVGMYFDLPFECEFEMHEKQNKQNKQNNTKQINL